MSYSPKRLNLRRISIAFLWIYIDSIWLWFALRLVFFDRIWWLCLLDTNAFYLLVPSIILLPIAIRFALKKQVSKYVILGLTLPVAIFAYCFGQLLIPPQLKSRLTATENLSSIDPSPIAFKAMSFNLLFSNRNYPKIIQSIRSSNPDLIGFQEAQAHHLQALKQALTEYPYSAIHPAPKFHNIAFFSRFPIESATILPADSIDRGMSVVVKIQDRSLTVIVVHLTPNYVPLVPWQQYPNLLQARYTRRAAEIDYLLQFTRLNPDPAIVLCDCNLTDTSQTYLQMSQGLSDSFAEVGWGFGHTFQGEDWKFPLQRLDYIWHTKNHQKAIDAYVGNDGGSDRLPILADFHYFRRSN